MISNVPDRDLFLEDDGKYKITETTEKSIEKTSTFTIHNEDHTLGNLLRMVPHPLENKIELRIRTTEDTSPSEVLKETLGQLASSLGEFKEKLKSRLQGD